MTPADTPQSNADVPVELTAYDTEDTPRTVAVPAGEDVTRREETLRAQGWRVVFGGRRRRRRALPRGVSPEDFARFNELLAGCVRRGIPLLRGVRQAARDIRSSRFRDALKRVEQDLERGRSPAEAFGSEESRLPPLYGRLLAAGARGGNLADVLLALSRNIRRDLVFRRGVCEALVYPVFLLVACCCFVGLFAVTIVPQLRTVGAAVGVRTYPAAGVLSLFASESPFTAPVIALCGFGVLLALFFLLRTTPFFRGLHEAVMRRLPLMRGLYEAAVWSAAVDTLGMLLTARVPAPEALALAGPALGSGWVTRAFERAADAVRRGESLSEALRNGASVPAPVLRAVDAGAAHGDLPASLAAAAREYRDLSVIRARVFVGYLPALLAFIFGGVLLFAALAVFGQYVNFWSASW